MTWLPEAMLASVNLAAGDKPIGCSSEGSKGGGLSGSNGRSGRSGLGVSGAGGVMTSSGGVGLSERSPRITQTRESPCSPFCFLNGKIPNLYSYGPASIMPPFANSNLVPCNNNIFA